MYQRDVLLSRLLLAGFDAAAIVGASFLAVWLRHSFGIGGPVATPPWGAYVWPAVVITVALISLLAAWGLYDPASSVREELIQVAKATAIATMVVLTLSFFSRDYEYSRATVLLFFALTVPALMGTRALHRFLGRRLRSGADAGRRVAIVGLGPTGRRLAEALMNRPAYYNLVGFIETSSYRGNGSLNGIRVLGSAQDLEDIVQANQIDELFLADSSASLSHQQELIGACMEIGAGWRLVPNLAGLLKERVDIELVGGLPVVGLKGSRFVGYNWTIKRMFDILAAGLAGLVLLPFMAIIALAIKLTSRGPVLHRQERLGLGGRPFTLLKFRTMVSDAHSGPHQDYTAGWILGQTGGQRSGEPDRNGSVHKIVDDPRVTTVGKILRATSLDELPQLWNVIRGEMSIVGPRPPLPYEVERYTEAHKRRFEALPGITGLWQVSGRNRLSFEEMVQLDVSYIENWSIRDDVRIVLRTIPALITERGH